MTKIEVVQELQKQTKENPVFNAVFHVLALRELPRYNLTPDGLYYRMRREGFQYGKNDYLEVFKLLDNLGLARMIVNKEGKIEQIKDFRLPIPKLGALACGQDIELDGMSKLLRSGKTPKAEPFKTRRSVPETAHVVVTQELQTRRQPNRRMVVTRMSEAGVEHETSVPTREPRVPRSYQTPEAKIILTVLLNGKPINIPVPKNITAAELSKFIGELMGMDNG